MTRRRLLPKWLPVGVTLLALSVTLGAGASSAHDPSTSGGLFRSRNAGATWASANPERIIGAAISLAISPTDPNHLLLATESGLMRSSNGGRDWILESLKSNGAAFVVVFGADGRRALVSTASDIFRTEDGNLWRTLTPPPGTTPARAMVRGAAPGRVYLAGWKRFAQSDDWGTTWVTAADGLPPGPVIALAVQPGPAETVYAVVDGRIWARTDGTPVWQSRMGELTTVQVEALALDPSDAARIWAVGAGQVFRSDDSGGRWQAVGQPLQTGGTAVHSIAASGTLLLVSTDQGLYRSADAGNTWQLVTDNLPGHLDAGPLVRDPANPATLYAGFTLTPYSELWRAAMESRARLEQLDPRTFWFWIAVLIGVLAAAVGVGWLAGRAHRPASSPVSPPRSISHVLRMDLARPLREPLVQFFVIGAALFLLNHWLGSGGNPAGRRIEVSSAQAARLIQAFSEQRGRPPTASEAKTVIDEYVREEILVREALEMGLDRGDVVVRRRLAQKMAALVGDLEGSGDPTEEELRTFFDFHADRYRGPVRVRFTQLYFNGERRGASAEADARGALERIRAAKRLPQTPADRGDDFSPPLSDGLRSQAELAELFGQGFAEAALRLPTGVWEGPIRSKLGYHLVRVDERSVQPVPELAAVRDRVIADWRGGRRAETDAAGLARLRTRYEVVIAEPRTSSGAGAEAGRSR